MNLIAYPPPSFPSLPHPLHSPQSFLLHTGCQEAIDLQRYWRQQRDRAAHAAATAQALAAANASAALHNAGNGDLHGYALGGEGNDDVYEEEPLDGGPDATDSHYATSALAALSATADIPPPPPADNYALAARRLGDYGIPGYRTSKNPVPSTSTIGTRKRQYDFAALASGV